MAKKNHRTKAKRREDRRRAAASVIEPGVHTLRLIDEDIRPWAELAETYRNVYLSGMIEDDMAARQQQILHWLDLKDNRPIRIWINSVGGDLFAGIQLYDTIRGLRSETETIVLGLGASMAGILLQAGTRRLIGPTSQLMLHELRAGTSEATTSKAKDDARLLADLEKKFLDILTSRSKLKRKELQAMWERKDAWFDAESAVKHRLADAIYTGGK